MGADVLTAAKAWAINDDLCRDVRVILASEPPGLETVWREATKHLHSGPNFWTDAYLAAFAEAGDYTIVTCDRGFRRHRRVSVRLLAPTV
jgi:predicted nucleic acid-binding protein